MENTYNGWKNRDTWLLALWINNTEILYNIVKNNKQYFLKKPMRYIVTWAKDYGMTDEVNYKNVDKTEIYDMIKEL